jgi:ribose transport system permease protein
VTATNTELPARSTEAEGRTLPRWLGAIGIETTLMVLLIAILIAISAATTEYFLALDNIRAILVAAASTGIAAVGLTFVTLSGNFFSLAGGATATAGGVAFAELQSHGWAAIPALAVMLAIACAIGVAQGVVVAKGANPIIVTLAASGAIVGLAGVVDHDQGVTVGTTWLAWFGTNRIASFPVVIYAFLVTTVLAEIFLTRQRAGRSLMLVGSNRRTAQATGLSFARATVIAFVLASVCCAIVGLQSVLQFHYADTTSFDSLTFNALAAVLVGGVALQGGEGSPVSTALGAVFIAVLGDFMNLHNYSTGAQLTVQGVVVVVAVTAFHVLRRSRGTR